MFVVLASLICGVASATASGPAPNSGDGMPDGSGFDQPSHNSDGKGMGPAPNSGDGVSDGSGF
jgi:hypothetical protein